MKTVLVTGSSQGIGLAIAKYLADRDYQVILNSRSELKPEVLALFDGATYPVDSVVGDVSDYDGAKDMIKEVYSKYDTLDVLVNNAGINRDRLIIGMKERDFDDVIATNLKGTFNMCRHAAAKMVKQEESVIINISSIAGTMGNAGQTNYSASKAGVLGLTKSLARELAVRNIRVNAIAPGVIESDMTADMNQEALANILEMVPLQRMGRPEEIAHAVEFLIDNAYMTGQVIEVNGGLYM